jgi:hypothetical protein
MGGGRVVVLRSRITVKADKSTAAKSMQTTRR